jgi:hypothetical protein
MVGSTMMGIMGQIGSYTGKAVAWDQAMKSAFFYPPKPEEVRSDMTPPVKPNADGIYPVFTPGETQLL